MVEHVLRESSEIGLKVSTVVKYNVKNFVFVIKIILKSNIFPKIMSKASSRGRKQGKRVVLTLRQKIDVCQRLDSGVNRRVLMDEYNISSSTIYDIKARKQQLLKFFADSESNRNIKKRRNLRKPRIEQLDAVLYEWFKMKRSEGSPMTGPMLIEKAKDFYNQMQLSERCIFSDGWLSCFKHRHGIRKLDVSDDREDADEYRQSFVCLINEHDLTAEEIYNANETAFFWRCLPSSTLAGADETGASGYEKNKDRVTVLACANAAGTHKLKLLVIGKYDLPRAYEGVQHQPVTYMTQSNALMDRDIFQEWFYDNFVPEVKQHLKERGRPENSKVILLLDNCGAHPRELVSGQILTTFLPANVTSIIKPMDQGIIQNMKCNYRTEFFRKLINHKGTVQDFQSTFTIRDAVYGVSHAWNMVKRETLQRAWRNLWPDVISSDMSSSQAEFKGFNICETKNDSTQTLEFLKKISNSLAAEMHDDDIEEWLVTDRDIPVFPVCTDENLIESIVNPKREEREEMDSEEDEENKEIAEKISWEEADAALQTFLKFAESESCYSAQERMQLNLIRSAFLQKIRDQGKQTIF